MSFSTANFPTNNHQALVEILNMKYPIEIVHSGNIEFASALVGSLYYLNCKSKQEIISYNWCSPDQVDFLIEKYALRRQNKQNEYWQQRLCSLEHRMQALERSMQDHVNLKNSTLALEKITLKLQNCLETLKSYMRNEESKNEQERLKRKVKQKAEKEFAHDVTIRFI